MLIAGCSTESEQCTIEFCMEEYGELLFANPNIHLKLPTHSPTKIDEKSVIRVSVTNDNNYYVQDIPISQDQIEKSLLSQVALTGDSIIELSGDKASSWESNVLIIDIAKSNNLKLVIKTKVN